jgi:hypothetical protein
MNDILLKASVNNNYKISHIGKNRLLRWGEPPIRDAATPSALHVFNMFRDDNCNQMAAGDDDAAGDNNARAPLQMIQQEAVWTCQSCHHITLHISKSMMHGMLCV